MQANRLSAQRSRQRKLEREAQLTRDVEELGQELAQLAAQEDMLRREEGSESPPYLTSCPCWWPMTHISLRPSAEASESWATPHALCFQLLTRISRRPSALQPYMESAGIGPHARAERGFRAAELAQQVQTCEHELAVVRNRILTMRAETARMQQECGHILDQHPHLRDEVSKTPPSTRFSPCQKPAINAGRAHRLPTP